MKLPLGKVPDFDATASSEQATTIGKVAEVRDTGTHARRTETLQSAVREWIAQSVLRGGRVGQDRSGDKQTQKLWAHGLLL